MFIMFKKVILSYDILSNLNVLNMGGHSECSSVSKTRFSYFPAHLTAGICCGVLFNTFKMFKKGNHLSCFEHSEHFEQGSGAD